MAVKVVDASAIGALVFGEPASGMIAERLSGATLTAPALLSFELANIAVKKLRRHPEQREALLAAHALSDRLSIDVISVDFAAVIALAETTGLTAYDASYLWLARQLGAELITLDTALQEASAS